MPKRLREGGASACAFTPAPKRKPSPASSHDDRGPECTQQDTPGPDGRQRTNEHNEPHRLPCAASAGCCGSTVRRHDRPPLSRGTHSLWSTPRHSKSVACRAAARARRLRHTPTVHAAASTTAAAADAAATAAVDAIGRPPPGAPAAVGAEDARGGRGASECAGASERAGAAVAGAQAHAYFGCASSRQIPQLFSSSDSCAPPSHTTHTTHKTHTTHTLAHTRTPTHTTTTAGLSRQKSASFASFVPP